jgi:hypothetical protein
MAYQNKPAKWEDLTPTEQKQLGNGCGLKWFPTWLKHIMFGWFFETSCRRHDFAYIRGGSRLDRFLADRGLYKSMKKDASRFTNRWVHLYTKTLSFVYYYAVRVFGIFIFNYGPYLTIKTILEKDKRRKNG